ncbi:beta-glucosidase [Ceratocystis pirilliformis]|uniref:beta-glucosidase n=1 Tax=Ceratocystis pirilliformis TaxID=259994 RepID=A0ABR3ZKN7_9PEZI
MHKLVVFASALLAAVTHAYPSEKAARSYNSSTLAHSDPFYPSPWMDPEAIGWEEAYAKAKEFVSQLTLLEKVNLTTGVGWESERCVGNVGSIPRFGMRGLCLQDSPVGVRMADYVSVFPSGQVAAATFDRSLIFKRGEAIGREHRAKGIDVMLGPVAGPLGRTPTGGRNWEGFSPDPYLTGVGMEESVRGIQEKGGVIACAKHWIGNEQEHFRQAPESMGYGDNITESLSSNIDDRTMHELYMWPFADAVRAGVGSFMCSYQQVNNSYSCQNSKLNNNLLKGELGFQGFIMSDWQAQHTGVSSAVAGLDMAMPGDTTMASGRSFWGANLTLAVVNGTLPEWRIDDMAMRIMAAFFKVGMSPDSMPDINFSSWTKDTYGYVHNAAKENYEIVNQHVDARNGKEHGNLIREIAAKGTVLLKNDGILPLNKPKFVAVVGEDAGPNLWGPNSCSDRGCDNGTLAMGWGSGTADFSYLVTPDTALLMQALEDGSRYESILSNYAWTHSKALVSQANATAIVFVNADSGEGYISVDGNIGDRNSLTLWHDGDALIQNVSSVCSSTIVVIHSTGPVLLNNFYDHPNVSAILWAGLPGQESGRSIVDVLYGRVNPAGRSPFTWGRSVESYGAQIIYEPNNGGGAPQDTFSEGLFVDYRYFDKVAPNSNDSGAPVYEFGYGLSYTTFEYSDLEVKSLDAEPYSATTGESVEAPVLGNFSTDLDDYLFPDNIRPIYRFIYPYLNNSDAASASDDDHYGQTSDEFLPPNAIDGSSQPRLSASGAPGGNPRLYDVLFQVSATITNIGDVVGDEVPQLYVSHGGPTDPVKVLRGFDRLTIEPGSSVTFSANITRRDLSNWCVVSQDWVITRYPKTVYVGSSSRNLPLKANLQL